MYAGRKNGTVLHRDTLIILIILAVSQILFSQLFIIKLSNASIFPVPGLPQEAYTPAIHFLIAVPWILAAGMLGMPWSLLIAALGGLFVGATETHQVFSVFEAGGLAFIYTLLVRQNYRARFYRILRHPLAAALVLSICSIPVLILSTFFSTPGTLETRLDYALTQVWIPVFSRVIEFLVAGLVAEFLYIMKFKFWIRPSVLVPSLEETSLRLRILFGATLLVSVLFFSLTIGDWLVAGNAAKQMVKDRLVSIAEATSNSLPYFLETGQNLLPPMATMDLLTSTSEQARALLEKRRNTYPFFIQFVLINAQGKVINWYPDKMEDANLTGEEKAGANYGMKGVESQTYLVLPPASGNSSQVSFMAAIIDPVINQPKGILLGRVSFENLLTRPVLTTMNSLKDWDGEAVILDDKGRIIYDTVPGRIGENFIGTIPKTASFYEDLSGDGSRRYAYYQPTLSQSWSVILSVPAERIQHMSLEIALPLVIILLVVSAGTFLFLGITLGSVTQSLKKLSVEASLIAKGQLSQPLDVSGEDEVGQLGRAFEVMRVSLKARLEELNRLLRVSQGVASSLKVEKTLQPILEAAIAEGAAAARVVLIKEVTLEQTAERLFTMGLGPHSDIYAFLDEQIFEQGRSQPMLTVPNLHRVRRVNVPAGKAQPGSLIALALRTENHYYGILWVAYDQPHNFTEEEARFLGTLSGEATLAAINASLYASAEIGRQRFAAVLASSPEPVLLIDEKYRLLLINPAAMRTPGLVIGAETGRPIREVVANLDLIELITQPVGDKNTSREISLPGGRVYYANVSPVVVDNHVVGLVCILQDITHYKHIDQLKSEFVSTVSHDLRSPLTLMRGYATMMQMVGELNEQQKSFQKKIVGGVENMTRLVNNLLDLGRLDAGIPLQRERVIAQEIVSEVLTNLQPNAVQKNIRMEHESATMPPIYLEADRFHLGQALTNLVDNAVKYSSVNGLVKVSIQQKTTSVIFAVQDTGIGIAPLDLPRLFEKFYRSGRRETSQQKGSGLGLAIVKSIADRHGGKVWVESQLGKGSTFFLEVPLQSPN